MTEFVVIRFNATDSAVQRILVDDNGTRQSRVATGSLDQAAGEVGERAVIVLVPATDVLTTSVHSPVRGAAKLRAALPFALEEDLADDIESLHFAAGKAYASGRLPVAIVAREKMDDWLSRLSAAGITAAKIVSEIYGLASIPGTMSLLVDDDRSLYHDGADAEFVMQGVTPRELLVAVGRLDDHSRLGPFADEVSLHLGSTGQYHEHEPTGRAGRVDRVAEDEASGASTSSGHLVAF